jgi:transcriptional regulator of acetoin/glycerol metabolism
MADWIDEVDRIDRSLHRLGVPANVRMKAVAEIMTILAQAEKAKRDRRQLVIEAVARCKGNVRKAAAEEEWSHETFYRELRKSQTPVTN